MNVAKCSVVIPVYKSADFVCKTIDQTVGFFEQKGISYELILVNDGSPDASWEAIKPYAEQNSCIIAINLLKNYGQHSAVLCGFRHASGDYVVTMDDDLQNPPEEIIHLLNEIEKGYDLVFGKFHKKKHGAVRQVGTWLINWINGKVLIVRHCRF